MGDNNFEEVFTVNGVGKEYNGKVIYGEGLKETIFE